MKLLYCFVSLLLATQLCACSTPALDSTVVRVRWTNDPESLDPLLYNSSGNATQACNLLHFSLIGIDYVRQIRVPLLAEAMPTVRYADSLTFIAYRLRTEARWDDGRPVLARDVVFTLAMMNCPGLPNETARAQFSFIERVQPDSADSRRFTLVCRGRSPEYRLASGDFPILPAHVLDPQGSLGRLSLPELRGPRGARYPAVAAFVQRYQQAQLDHHPMRLPGCGPYRLQKWEPGRYLTFQRKAAWWGDRVVAAPVQLQAYPRILDFEIIPDENTALLAFRRGQVDVYPRLPAKAFDRLRQSAKARRLSFYTADSYDMLTAGFNTRRPALHDRLTRQALARLFDVPALIAGTQSGYAYRSVGLISPVQQEFYDDSLRLLPYDPAAAAALLRRAGWQRQATGEWQRPTPAGGPPQRLALRFSYRTGEPAYEATALQFRAAAAAIGIPVALLPTERSLLTAQMKAGEVDIFLWPISGNPTSFNFAPILHSGYEASGNFSAFGTPTSNALIEELAAAENPARKRELMRRFQRLMQAESPLVVLYFLRYRLAADARFTGLQVSGLKPGYNVMTIRGRPANAS